MEPVQLITLSGESGRQVRQQCGYPSLMAGVGGSKVMNTNGCDAMLQAIYLLEIPRRSSAVDIETDSQALRTHYSCRASVCGHTGTSLQS